MDNSKIPAISVLIPIYNGEKFLKKCLGSILNQTFTDFEVVFIDDGCTDQSEEIIRSYSDARIQYYKNVQNRGIIYTLNRGIGLCRGHYIARMDCDDMMLETRLELQKRFLDEHLDHILVASHFQKIDQFDENLKTFGYPATSSELIQWKLLSGNFICHPTVMFRKSMLPENPYDELYQHAEDYALWLKLSKIGKINILSEVLLKYRIHSNSVSSTKSKTQVFNANLALGDHLKKFYHYEYQPGELAPISTPQEAELLMRDAATLSYFVFLNPLNSEFKMFSGFPQRLTALSFLFRRMVLILILNKNGLGFNVLLVLGFIFSCLPFSTRLVSGPKQKSIQ
ncbi:MAG: glycosyltransferase family 2 protein [Pseudobdellovibrionaceae bacterium]